MDTFKDAEDAGVGANVALALPGGLYVVGTIAEINRGENSVTMKDGRSVHFAPPAPVAAPADAPEEEEP
ncbi:MAG: hypothetical protein WA014_02575 [Minisyncoccia bacterium]